MHYRAFISHSHADAKFAAWLQRAIETWRVPTRLRAELGYSRIKPIFRDRTDLRASTSLGDALEDALRHSSALIVVCSNDAADSDWVDQEIARSRAFNPDAPILPIIAAGEPPHCFPESLLIDTNGNALEPLAADARKGFDGKRDALLKTIAGIIDVDFDVLKQRDFRRRQQKMGAVAALATGVAAVTLYLAYMAYEARDDANRRREQADDLVAFMLGDLRERLEPIGKLDVLDAVGDKALDYFSQLEGVDITPEVTLKHALAIRQIGEVQMARGNHEAALEAFQRSVSTLKAIRRDHPAVPRVSFEVAQSEFWIGNVHYEQSELVLAREGFQRYLDEARGLLREDDSSMENRQELYYAIANLAALEIAAGDYAAAESLLLESLEVLDTFADEMETVDQLSERQNSYSWLGEAAFRSGNLDEARSRYQQEFEILQLIVSQSADRYFEEMLSHSGRRLTTVELLLEGEDASIGSAEIAFSVSRELTLFDDENFYWLNAHCMAGVTFSEALWATGQQRKALEIAREIYPVARRLIEREPLPPEAASSYLYASTQLARVLNLLGQPDEAARIIDASRQYAFDATDMSTTSSFKHQLMEIGLVRGDIWSAMGETDAALAEWNASLGAYHEREISELWPRDLMSLYALSNRSGDRELSEKLLERLLGMGVRHQPGGSVAYVLSHVAL